MCMFMYKLESELGSPRQDIAQEQNVAVAKCHQPLLKNQAYHAGSLSQIPAHFCPPIHSYPSSFVLSNFFSILPVEAPRPRSGSLPL